MTSKQDSPKETWLKSDACKRMVAGLVCGLCFAMLWVIPVTGKGLVMVMREMQDHWARTDHRLKQRPDMVLLGIDADSLALDSMPDEVVDASPALVGMKQKWPWSRKVHAEVIDRLATAGARLIVVDVVLSGDLDEEGDAALERVLAKHRDKVVLASAFLPGEDGGQVRVVEPNDRFLGPLDNETASGFVNFRPDVEDGIVRRADFRMTYSEMNGAYPHPDEPVFDSLAAAAAKKIGVHVPPDRKRFQMALEGQNASAIYRPSSLHTLFVKEDWDRRYQGGAYFKDKIVFIGPTTPLFQDSHETVGGHVYGVQLHMQVLTALRADAWYQEGLLGGGAEYSLLLFAAGLCVAMLCALRWSRTSVLLLCAIVCLVVWLVVEYVAVPVDDILLGSVAAVFTALGGFAGAIVWQSMTERARRQQLHRQLQRSMSPDVADAIVQAPEGYYRAASGNRRQVTVLFADVRDFTNRSEHQDAVELVSQLNEYLGRMVEVIFSHGGTVDKFIGDAIMATWGALGGGDLAKQNGAAVAAAQEMLVALSELNTRWQDEGKKPFRIGVGIHHGEAIVGEIGSDQRTDFTVIGDTVNLASRIEGMTKAMGVELLVTSSVTALLPGQQDWLGVGAIRVKGREEAVELRIPRRGSDTEQSHFQKFLVEFQQGDFSQAADTLALLDADGPFAGMVMFYQSQLRHIDRNPTIAETWDGVLRMETK
ncbi:MAG: adenylate/guanylate cyclase domain-containing protein [Akkermansiaceae bacterium]|nr:adenylate/guanylate cyclase domain-containing protein [Akkermansiaceae bacterium]